MESFLLITPLPAWRGAPQPIAVGVSIRPLSPEEYAALEPSHGLLEHHAVDSQARTGFWLCYEFENPHPSDNVRYRRRQEAASKYMAHAMYAIQILLPLGAPNLFFLYRRSDGGLLLEATEHRPAYHGSEWARRCDVPPSFATDIPPLLEIVREVFRRPVLRLQIPIWLLEQGLTAPDRHIRILLWATGLDGVTRSGGVAAFSERLCELLGAETKIFPPSPGLPLPKYTVADVVENLYLLRTEMAHGLPFHEQFRKRRGFVDQDGQPLAPEFAEYRYDHVLEECAAFLLSKSLRQVLLTAGLLIDPA